MLTIKTEIIINKPPEAVYNWVLALNDEKYRKWHPAHRAFRREGSKVFLKEEVEGQKLTVKARFQLRCPTRSSDLREESVSCQDISGCVFKKCHKAPALSTK